MSGIYAKWEDVKCSRQEYATAAVQQFQRGNPGIKRFSQLVQVFRDAGEAFDRWERERGAAA